MNFQIKNQEFSKGCLYINSEGLLTQDRKVVQGLSSARTEKWLKKYLFEFKEYAVIT